MTTSHLPQITLEQNGQHIYLTDKQIELLGDLTVPRIGAITDSAHGYDLRRQRQSLLRSPYGHRIPNAGCLLPLFYWAASRGVYVRRQFISGIAQLPHPVNLDVLDYPGLAEFARTCERGLIQIADGFNAAIVIGELADAFPGQHIVVLGSDIATLYRLQGQLFKAMEQAGIPETEREPIPVVHDRQRLPLADDEQMPTLVLSTFLGAGEFDFAISDIVIFLEARQCIHARAQTILQQIDARFRLFGISRAGQQMSPYEAGVTMAVFGPELIDLMPGGQTRRDVHVASVKHEQQWIPGQRNATEFFRKCIWENDCRNQAVANLAEALTNADVNEELPNDVAAWLAERDSKPQAVTVLVNNLHHARALSQKLLDWPVIVNEDSDLSGMVGSFRNRVKRNRRRWLNGSHQIVMTDATQTFDGRHSDVIIWAGGGPHPPTIPNFWFGQRQDVERPLLIVDFHDNFNAQARNWSRKRQNGYGKQDIFGVGVEPVIGRIRRFLRQQPGGLQ